MEGAEDEAPREWMGVVNLKLQRKALEGVVLVFCIMRGINAIRLITSIRQTESGTNILFDVYIE